MALRLTVVSEQRVALGGKASIVVGVGGGSLGRAPDNDWILPDRQCYVSAHHARVQFRHGTYYLLDTSTNGVYVNGGTVRISPRSIYPLRDGDTLRLGSYEIAVRIDAEPGEAPEASSIFPVGSASDAADDGYPPDIGVALDVQELLQTAVEIPPAPAQSRSRPARQGMHEVQAERIGAVGAFGQSVSIEDTGLQPLAHTARPLALVPPVSKPRREARADAPRGSTASNASSASTVGTAGTVGAVGTMGVTATVGAAGAELSPLQAFCRGAGVQLTRVAPEAQSRLLHLAGLLLREALMGLKGLALTQRELRDHTGLVVEREEPAHVALSGLPVDELLRRLLLGHEHHELDAVQWLRDIAGGSRAYDQALMGALPAALAEFTARLDPRALSHTGMAGSAGPEGTADGSSAQDAQATGVTARYRSITESPPGGLPHLFGEALARAFAIHYRRNAPNR